MKNNIKSSISDIITFAENKGGQLLSTEYINSKQKLKWQCKNGHIWEARWTNIKHSNQWCLKCSYKIPTIYELQQHAITKGGILISTEYKNNNTKLTWQCKNNHLWEANWNSIKDSNTWCPTCANNLKLDIKELQHYAITKGGILISTEYKNNRIKLKWQCNMGHTWEASWRDIKHGNSWCCKCIGLSKPDITELQQHANSKNGSLISVDYINSKKPLLWKCENNHQWVAAWYHIKQGSWCPECSRFKTELLCKSLLEQNLNILFTKTRFIYNNNKYEFDGYNEEHKIAFEYHGYQHYIYPNHFHKTETKFIAAQLRDRNKEQYCIKNNIKLIVIPYIVKDLESYIKEVINGL